MDETNKEQLDYFVPLLVTAEIVGILAILLTFYWFVGFAAGFGLSGKALFSWHPLFMIIGMIFLLGNGILMFRIFRDSHKYTLKLAHAAVNAVGLVITLLGTTAVIVYHNQLSINNFYSLHSWIGIGAVAIYIIQAIVSIFAFLLNGISNPKKAMLLPMHVFVGRLVFILGVSSAVTGFNEYAFISLKNYSSLPAEALVINITGVLLVIFGILVGYLGTNVHYKRYSRPEDSQLLERRAE